jgi:hypothetical protein
MAKFHFRSMEAPQNKNDVTNRFGDRDFILAVCTCFLRKVRPFRSYSRFSFVKEWRNSISGRWKHRRTKVTSPFTSGWRFSYSLCRNFPFILFRSIVIQEFHVCATVKKSFSILGANMTPKFSLQISTPQKGTSLRKSASIEALWSR